MVYIFAVVVMLATVQYLYGTFTPLYTKFKNWVDVQRKKSQEEKNETRRQHGILLAWASGDGAKDKEASDLLNGIVSNYMLSKIAIKFVQRPEAFQVQSVSDGSGGYRTAKLSVGPKHYILFFDAGNVCENQVHQRYVRVDGIPVDVSNNFVRVLVYTRKGLLNEVLYTGAVCTNIISLVLRRAYFRAIEPEAPEYDPEAIKEDLEDL